MTMKGQEEDAVQQQQAQVAEKENSVRLSALIAADAAGCLLPVQATEK